MPVSLLRYKRIKPVHEAAAIFLTFGAAAAFAYFANPLRAKILMPRVFLRAKYLVRCAKRLEAKRPKGPVSEVAQPDRPILDINGNPIGALSAPLQA